MNTGHLQGNFLFSTAAFVVCVNLILLTEEIPNSLRDSRGMNISVTNALAQPLENLAIQPTLALFTAPIQPSPNFGDQIEKSQLTKLYLIPTTHGESYDPDFAPNPSPLADLPNLERWTLTYVVTVIEIMAGRRSPAQLARSTHRFTYNSLLKKVGTITEVPKIRRIHRNQPIAGVVEVTAILVFKNRVRSLIARFEGVDRKWLCTELELI